MKKMKLVLMLLVVTFTIACGQKKDDTFSKPMYFPQGIYIGIDPVLHLTWPTGGSTIYPSAGIPLSTGTAWGTSIVNNSSAWNTAVTEAHTAFLYGPHAGLYKLLNAKVDYVTEVIINLLKLNYLLQYYRFQYYLRFLLRYKLML